jgi:endonuclease/exonuclease/phosphatase family metal-dependent hydrolase
MRLATWNIHKFAGSDGKRDAQRTIATLKAINADIVAIQEFVAVPELDGGSSADIFAAACGYRAIEHKLRRRNGHPQSNLLLTRVPVRNLRLVPLRCPGIEERGAISVDVDGGGILLRVAATHFGLPPSMRLNQLKALLKACDPGGARPFVLLGDLNVLPFLDPADGLLRDTFGAESTEATYPSLLPFLALDRIAVRGARTARLRAWRKNPARFASDHLPLVADLEIKKLGAERPARRDARRKAR